MAKKRIGLFRATLFIVLSSVFLGLVGHCLFVYDHENSDPVWTHSAEAYTYTITTKEPIARGVCVDSVLAILSILERHYSAMDRIKVAVSNDHCQAVLMSLNDTVYLSGRNTTVYKSESEFSKDASLVFVSPELFKGATKYYRPTITLTELLKYIEKNAG